MAHTVEEIQEYLDTIPAEHLGWAFTANHSHLVPEGVDGFIDAFGTDRIGEVRLADNSGDYEIHLIPGERTLDFMNLFRRLEEAGYKGHYTMAYGFDIERIQSRNILAQILS